jgi:hypothetical protein
MDRRAGSGLNIMRRVCLLVYIETCLFVLESITIGLRSGTPGMIPAFSPHSHAGRYSSFGIFRSDPADPQILRSNLDKFFPTGNRKLKNRERFIRNDLCGVTRDCTFLSIGYYEKGMSPANAFT